MIPSGRTAFPAGAQLEKGQTMNTNGTGARKTIEPEAATTASEPATEPTRAGAGA